MTAEIPTPAIPMTGSMRRRLGDRALQGLALLAVLGLALLMVLLIYYVGREAAPAMRKFGLSFLTSSTWNAVTDKFGALDLIWGTLATSLFALVIAVPIAIAIAMQSPI